jgi:hypothetical protein
LQSRSALQPYKSKSDEIVLAELFQKIAISEASDFS